MDLASVSHLLELGDEQISNLLISLSRYGQFCNAHFRLSSEKLSMELSFHLLPTSNRIPWQCCIPNACCPCQRVKKQYKLEMIEIFVVNQLPTLHSESSNMLQGRLAIFSKEQREIRDPPWVGVLPIYHFWIRFIEFWATNLPEA